MSVRFDIVMKNGLKIARNDACFGRLNCLPLNSHGAIGGHPAEEVVSAYFRSVPRNEPQGQLYDHIAYHPVRYLNSYIWSHPEGKPAFDAMLAPGETSKQGADYKTRCAKNYFKVIQEILDDMPWWKGMITVHPYQGVVRCHIKDHPADKMMTTLFTLRNLAQYDHGRTYLMLRELGYRPRVALMASQLYVCNVRAGVFNGTLHQLSLGESSVLNPDTFGRQAAIAFLKQEGTAPARGWVQAPFKEQVAGYRRDSQLRDADIIFDEGSSDTTPEDSWDEDDDDVGINYYAKMVDVYSIPNDTVIIGATYSTSARTFHRGSSVTQRELSIELNNLLQQAGM